MLLKKTKKPSYANAFHPLYTFFCYIGDWKGTAILLLIAVLRDARDLGCVVAIAFSTNQVINGGDIQIAVIFMIFVMLCGAPLLAVQRYSEESLFLKTKRKLQYDISKNISKMPWCYAEKCRTGELLETYTMDMEIVCHWVSSVFPGIVRFVVYILGALTYSVSQSLLLTASVFPIIILIAPLFLKISEPLKAVYDAQRKAAADFTADMQDILADPDFLKAYSLEETMGKRVEKGLLRKEHAERQSGHFLGIIKALGILGSYLPGFVAAACGVFFLQKRIISIGFLIGFVQMVVQRFGQTLPEIGRFSVENQKASASAARILALLHGQRERQTGEADIPTSQNILSLEDVTFSYQEKSTPVLKHVTIHVNQGQTIALVGKSGSGKSTIVKLLLGLYETYNGKVQVYGRNVTDWNLSAMRALIAPVFQDSFLFSMSIRDNLACADISDEKIWNVMERTGLHNFVSSLPQGLNTYIGEQGTTLSGGQRQLLSVARALIKDAPIILLDEPTSALDTVTEHRLQCALHELTRGKTTLVVTHRLHTIRHADHIYVLDNGTVVQEGNHDTLYSRPGIYRSLYLSQIGEGTQT